MLCTQVRDCNYSCGKDVALAHACVCVSESPFVGSEQNYATFFERIWNEYRERNPSALAAGPLNSVTSRFKLIVKQFIRFSGHVTVIASKPTGVNESDILRTFVALFNEKRSNLQRKTLASLFTLNW